MALLLVGLFLAACRPAEEVTPTPAAATPTPTKVTPVPAKKEPYKVGYTSDVTGPGADTWTPTLEAFRIYIQRLNDAGGIDGHPIQLIAEDNRSKADLAAAHAKKFIETDKVHIILESSSSVTQAPVIAEAEKANVPVLIVEEGCPKEALPPKPKKHLFCDFTGNVLMDNVFTTNFIKKMAGPGTKVAGVSFDVPVSRGGIEAGVKHAKEIGLEVVDHIVVPLGRPDLTPYASRIIAKGAEWVFGWGIWELVGGPFLEALRKQGWEGSFIGPPLTIAEEELPRLKDDKLFVPRPMAMFAENLPIHQTIRKAAEKYGATSPPTRLVNGWVAGMIVETAFRQCGWPCPTDKLVEVMNNLTVDTQGLTGAPLKYTPTNHFGGEPLYKVYRWDSEKGKIIAVTDWVKAEE